MPRPEARPHGPLRALWRGLAYWGPVAVALGLFAQLALLGLKPALAERRRLAAAEEELALRLEGELERQAELSALRQALEDPVYRERLRLERAARAADGGE